MTHDSGDDQTTAAPDGGTPDNGLEEAMQRLEAAGQAVQQAMSSAADNGPALQHTAHAVLQVFKYVEFLGIQLGELRDMFRSYTAADIGRDMAHLGNLIELGSSLLATPPEELTERLQRIKDPAAAIVDPQGVELGAVGRVEVKVSLTGVNLARLVEAARRAGVDPAEFATAAVLRAVDTVMGPVTP